VKKIERHKNARREVADGEINEMSSRILHNIRYHRACRPNSMSINPRAVLGVNHQIGFASLKISVQSLAEPFYKFPGYAIYRHKMQQLDCWSVHRKLLSVTSSTHE